MYPKLTARLIVRSIQVVWFWGSLPLRWNKDSGALDLINTKWRQFLRLFNALAQLFYFSFLVFRYVQLYRLPSIPAALKTYLEYILLCYCFGVMFQAILYFRLHAVVDFINGYNFLFKKIPRELDGSLKVGPGCNKVLARYMAFGHLALSLNVAILFRRPGRLVYFTSLLENPGGLGPLKIAPFALAHIYVWWSMWSLLHFVCIHSVACAFAQVEVLKCINRKMNTTEGPGLRGRKLASIYRELQVLQTKFDNGLGLLIAGEKVPVTGLVIRGIYSGMMDTGAVRILCCFTGLMAWKHAHDSLKVFGEVHEASSEALKTMKHKNKGPWFRRFHRSCAPLKIRLGELVFCDGGLPMSLTAFIFDSIVSLLVAQST